MADTSCWDEYTDNYSDESEIQPPKKFEEMKKEKLIKKYTEYCDDLIPVNF
jgi:hypothetical protein